MRLLRPLAKLSPLPKWLNWLLSVVEPLIVLVITLLVFYSTCWLVFGNEHDEHRVRLIGLMKDLNDNWKAGLLLLLLLFYRTVRVFLEQAEEAFGVKRNKTLLSGEPQTGSNPPSVP
jgi:hypothetical protein